MKRVSLIVALTCLLTGTALAETAKPSCLPAWANPDLPRTTNTYQFWSSTRNEPVNLGPRLNQPMYYWNRGALFRIEYGFFNPWFVSQTDEDIEFPEKEDFLSNLSSSSTITGYDPSTGAYNPDLLERDDVRSPTLWFWMPSLRYVEQNMRTGYDFHPCEPGREPAGKGEYAVQFRIEWPGLAGVEKSPQVERFENAEKKPILNPDFFQIFNDQYAVNLHCTEDRGCQGQVWDKKRNYILSVMFPEILREQDPESFWQPPAFAAIQLLESWKVEITESTSHDP